MEVTAKMVSDLRKRTGAGIMDCKKALAEKNGDIEASITHLREQGLKASELKSNRDASEGLIMSYIHPGSKIGSLLEINCETDFVARTDDFKELAHDVAMQIAAMAPIYVSTEDALFDNSQEATSQENILMQQPFIKDPTKSIQELVNETIGKLGENIRVRRFTRFSLGE